jgi:DNA-binding NarL/FixJ family response regulator
MRAVLAGGIRFERAPLALADLQQVLIAVTPQWLVLGAGLSDAQLHARVGLARRLLPRILIVVLVARSESQRIGSWLQDGARIVTGLETTPDSLACSMGHIVEHDCTIFSAAFYRDAASLRQARREEGDIPLSAREQEVARLVVRGFSNAEIAAALCISPKTVESHLTHLHEKLHARTRAHLIQRIGRLGLT